ncbi:MAG TPA: hypothetical protein VEZ14_04520 [Dehalococcoidia bacterium]|nr:hypothetical protein [Dehalococcoidia bacterium]
MNSASRIPAAILTIAVIAGAAVLIACGNATGLSQAPRATFSQLACLDVNGDHRLNAADAAVPAKVPDFDADRQHDAQDAAFFQGIDIALNPTREAEACARGSTTAPEYLVAHGYFEPAAVSCSGDKQAVLLVGVGGGVVNLKDRGDAAGVRSMIDGIQRAYDDRGVQTIAVLAGPAVAGGQNIHTAMEQWLTHAVQVYLERYPCMRVLLLGHSHGAVTVDVVGAALEARYAARIVEVVDVDRVTALYTGNTTSRPRTVHVLNIYEQNRGVLRGAPYDAPNATNWDASDQLAPKDGDKGGPPAPVNHTTIDNSASVKALIIADVMRRQ